MIINRPHLCTKLPIFYPKYNTEHGEWEVWLSVNKVAYSSPIIIIEFTKAKHLKGQRFCVKRQEVERSPIGTNGKIAVYRVPFSKLEPWESAQEVRETANMLFED